MENHNGKIHYKWPFSIAMLNYQGVYTKPRQVDATKLETWKITWENIENIGLSSSLLPSKGPAHFVHPDGK